MLQDEDLEAESEVDEPESYLELMADAPRDKRIALKDSDILGGFAIAATELGLDPIPSGGLVQKPRAARALLDPAVKCVDVQSMLQAADLFTKPDASTSTQTATAMERTTPLQTAMGGTTPPRTAGSRRAEPRPRMRATNLHAISASKYGRSTVKCHRWRSTRPRRAVATVQRAAKRSRSRLRHLSLNG